jgi:hypothetical protein
LGFGLLPPATLSFPVKLVTYGARAFGVAGPACWNTCIPNYLKESELKFDPFKRQIKTYLFCTYKERFAASLPFSALEAFVDARYKCIIENVLWNKNDCNRNNWAATRAL